MGAPVMSFCRIDDKPIRTHEPVSDILAELNEAADGHAGAGGGFDAAFVAVGAHIGRRAYIPVGDSARIMDAVSRCSPRSA